MLMKDIAIVYSKALLIDSPQYFVKFQQVFQRVTVQCIVQVTTITGVASRPWLPWLSVSEMPQVEGITYNVESITEATPTIKTKPHCKLWRICKG